MLWHRRIFIKADAKETYLRYLFASPIQYINLLDSTTSLTSSPQVTAKTGVQTLDSSFMVGNVRVGPSSGFYKGLIGMEDNTQTLPDFGEYVRRSLSNDEAHEMIKPISDDEIKKVVFSFPNDKAPSPDGFTAAFLKEAWNTIGLEICIAIRNFFESGKFIKSIHSTMISIIPKVEVPKKASDFRPIACCNVLYKELFHGYKRKNLPERCAFKVDLMKAYDTIRWQFLVKHSKLLGPSKGGAHSSHISRGQLYSGSYSEERVQP
ncbi:hypothetical protein BUALT_Bualt03G0187500 [Buddleja alternifolia]|uniref:Reverse transcriptase domain-containing protein n=1 Tax=Buddleja alternifolia TaxID=168488 RepID=A0AAV6XZB1_9LAMI|nr:hypothetical protein BUALT_Bualt03G0187500 [Buddleja alternifolia]